MKKIILIVFFFAINQSIANAQTDINVVITGTCAEFSGTYVFNGLVNGKNNYVAPFVVEGETFIVGVGYDNTKWVLYGEGDLTDDGFRNIAVPAGSLPPFVGWINSGCEAGTMTINQTLALNDVSELGTNILLAPNPAKDQIVIQSIGISDAYFDYKISDVSGRIVGQGNARVNQTIAIDHLDSGHYIVTMKGQNGAMASKKLIKL